jgi:hypothetical protein
MPLDVLGRTRATLMKSASFLICWLVLVFGWPTSKVPVPKGLGNLMKLHRDGDWAL